LIALLRLSSSFAACTAGMSLRTVSGNPDAANSGTNGASEACDATISSPLDPW
jgi:hypothetical protein